MKNIEFKIRESVPDDGVSIRRMVFDVLCEYNVPADPDGSDLDVMKFGLGYNNAISYVLEVDNKLVGSAIITPTKDNKVKLSKLFLYKEYRGMGFGKKLLDIVVDRAKKDGYDEIYLCTRNKYKEAVDLYKRNGWIRGEDQPPPGPDLLYYLRLK